MKINRKILLHLKLLDAKIKVLKVVLASKRSRRRRRKCLIRPINTLRSYLGYFVTMFEELKLDPGMFFRVFRMSVDSFNYIHKNLHPYLLKEKSNISPEERLAVTLRYLASGDRILSIALEFRIGESTCYKIIEQTCKVIFDRMSPVFLKIPTEKQWIDISKGFWQDWNMPNCISSADGTHVYIKAPANSGSLYFNYKKRFSIVLLAMCNHKYEFTLFDIGAPGSESDGGVLARSALGKNLRNNRLNIPQGLINLPNSTSKTPYYFVGDEAFGISQNMMRPYSGKHLSNKQAIFNYRLSRARRVIENSFGILKSRWQFLTRTMGFQPTSAVNCVLASMCLHNFLMTYSDETRNLYLPQDFSNLEIQSDLIQTDECQCILTNNAAEDISEINTDKEVLNGNQIRTILADYFMTPEGEVPWQKEYINRGSYQDK